MNIDWKARSSTKPTYYISGAINWEQGSIKLYATTHGSEPSFQITGTIQVTNRYQYSGMVRLYAKSEYGDRYEVTGSVYTAGARKIQLKAIGSGVPDNTIKGFIGSRGNAEMGSLTLEVNGKTIYEINSYEVDLPPEYR
jgi:hypothetical protein